MEAYSAEAKQIPLGVYEHYKGNQYRLLTIARHSETCEEFVVYESLYGDHDVWVRPLSLFTETVLWNGKEIPRFRLTE